MQIQEKTQKLQAQAVTIVATTTSAALDKVRDLLIQHESTTDDIEAKAKATRDFRGASGFEFRMSRTSSRAERCKREQSNAKTAVTTPPNESFMLVELRRPS